MPDNQESKSMTQVLIDFVIRIAEDRQATEAQLDAMASIARYLLDQRTH
jgi:hypothetical protein